MTDLEKFKEFFCSMGVRHEQNWGYAPGSEDSPRGNDVLSVQQAHFWFRDGVFQGTLPDEFGGWEPRLTGTGSALLGAGVTNGK